MTSTTVFLSHHHDRTPAQHPSPYRPDAPCCLSQRFQETFMTFTIELLSAFQTHVLDFSRRVPILGVRDVIQETMLERYKRTNSSMHFVSRSSSRYNAFLSSSFLSLACMFSIIKICLSLHFIFSYVIKLFRSYESPLVLVHQIQILFPLRIRHTHHVLFTELSPK